MLRVQQSDDPAEDAARVGCANDGPVLRLQIQRDDQTGSLGGIEQLGGFRARYKGNISFSGAFHRRASRDFKLTVTLKCQAEFSGQILHPHTI